MALLYLFIALAMQGAFTRANNDTEEITASQEVPEVNDEIVKDYHEAEVDWMDYILPPNVNLYPSSSVAMMEQAINSDKPIEEQLEDIKEMAEKITMAIQSEMANLLTYAMTVSEQAENCTENEEDDNSLRKKRSAETPMASSELINRLLRHIKSNNEYQNIAIEKMMTAQEIADKYGIEYRPDTEILTDLAFAANEHAKEMTSLLEDASNMRNQTKPLSEEAIPNAPSEDDVFYVYSKHHPENHESAASAPKSPINHYHYPNPYPNYDHHHDVYETQIPPPVQTYYSPAVTKKPNFFDTIDYYPSCSMGPMNPIIPIKEIEPEPELVGEEYEETITSKVLVDRGEEPGSATVNHVMTYTVSEKSHFRTPEIERLPQQMQYYFLLI